MTDAIADDALQAVLILHRSHPEAPALDVVDLAMKGREHSDLEFFSDALPAGTWLVPPNHFASLLWDAHDASLTTTISSWPPAATLRTWHSAGSGSLIVSRRYGLWRPWRDASQVEVAVPAGTSPPGPHNFIVEFFSRDACKNILFRIIMEVQRRGDQKPTAVRRVVSRPPFTGTTLCWGRSGLPSALTTDGT